MYAASPLSLVAGRVCDPLTFCGLAVLHRATLPQGRPERLPALVSLSVSLFVSLSAERRD